MGFAIDNQGAKFQAISKPQRDFFDCQDKFTLFAGGFGSGKSHVGSGKMCAALLFIYPGTDGLAVAPNYGDTQSILVPELLARFQELGVSAEFHQSTPQYIAFTATVNGESFQNKIHIRSAEATKSITGFSVSVAWVDEAGRCRSSSVPTEDLSVQVLARVRGVDINKGLVCCTSTHEGVNTWIARDFILDRKPQHTCFRGSTFDNPFMQDFAAGLVEQYPRKLVEQYVHGNLINLSESLVYFAFSEAEYPDGNIDDSVTIDPNRPFCLSMDFNAVPGCHAVVAQHRVELDEIWIIDEIHRKGLTVPGLVAEYKKRYGSGDRKPMTMIYGDAAGRARDTSIGETAYDWVKRAFQDNSLACSIHVPDSNPLREDRFISANAAFEDGKGRHVRIHPRCKKLIRDLQNVQRDESGRLDKTQERQGMVHMSDAATYFIHKVRPVNRMSVSGFVARKAG